MIRKNPYKDFTINLDNISQNGSKKENKEINNELHENQPNRILQALSKNHKTEYKTCSFYIERNIILRYEEIAKEKNMSVSEVINFVLKESLK